MSRYGQGVRVEHAVADDLRAHGYHVVRAASSKGAADVIALGHGEVIAVNVKRTRMPSPAERRHHLAVADSIPGVILPIVALKPARQPLEYRLLTGPGPRDWCTWEPCGAEMECDRCGRWA